MTDIALVLSPDGTGVDIAIVNGDILLDDGLQTAVLLSLLPNRRADPGDVVPPGMGRGGVYFDAFLPPLPDGSPDYYGSKLWLYMNCTATVENGNLILGAIRQSLDWMIQDGVAADITVTGTWLNMVSFATNIAISQKTPAGAMADTVFKYIWNTALGLLPA